MVLRRMLTASLVLLFTECNRTSATTHGSSGPVPGSSQIHLNDPFENPNQQIKPTGFLPTQEGTNWEYDGTYLFGNATATVLPSEEIDGKQCGVIEWTYKEPRGKKNVETVVRRYYVQDAETVLWVATASLDANKTFQIRKNDPPVTLLKLPLRVGAKWKSTTDPGSGEFVVTATDRLKTPAGEYECFVITRSGKPNLRMASTFWFAPGVGLIQEGTAVGTRSESLRTLRKFTSPGK